MTHKFIEDHETALIEAKDYVEEIQHSAQHEADTNGGKLQRENMDHWGTLLVNAQSLSYMLSEMIATLTQLRGES